MKAASIHKYLTTYNISPLSLYKKTEPATKMAIHVHVHVQ